MFSLSSNDLKEGVMSSEVDLSSIDFDDSDRYFGVSFSQSTSPTPNFSEAILTRPVCSRPFIQKAAPCAVPSEVEERAQKVARDHGVQIAPMEAGGSVEVKIEANWGGKDGLGVSVGAAGEVHDDHGNYAKGEVKQDSSGE